MKNILLLLSVVFALYSCSDDDYVIGGDLANAYVNKTTYDYLKSNPAFDTLVMAIDKIGLKDAVNAAKTFYAPTNYSIRQYVVAEINYLRAFDPMATYTFDDIPLSSLDSLKMYIYDQTLDRSTLTTDGIYTSLLGMELKLTKEPKEVYQGVMVSKPEYLYMQKKKGTRFDTFEEVDKALGEVEKDLRSLIQSSGIITTTGVVHVMENKHVLFFHRQ